MNARATSCLLLCAFAAARASGAVEVVARVVSPPPYSVGSPIEIEVFAVEPAAGLLFPKAPLDLGAFVIVAESAPRDAARRYAVVPALSGDLEFPPLPVSGATGGELARSAAIPLRVESRRPPGAPRLVDDLEPVRPPRGADWRLPLGIAVAAVLVFLLARRHRESRRGGPVATVNPVLDPSRALAALAARLREGGEAVATEVVIEASDLSRGAIEARIGYPAPRRTSEETAAALEAALPRAGAAFAAMLLAADDVKYGGARRSAEEAGRLLAAVSESLSRLDAERRR